MVNVEIRAKAAGSGVKMYKIAEAFGMRDSAFSRLLRKELSKEQKAQVLAIIDELAKEER